MKLHAGDALCRTDRLQVLPPPRRVDCTSNALTGFGSGASADQASLETALSGCGTVSQRDPGRAPDSRIPTVRSEVLMKSEASMLASFSSSKSICELPKLDIFSQEDDVCPVKWQGKKLQEKDRMQLIDMGHDTYRCQLGKVAAAVAGDSVTTSSNPVSLLALMDEEADEV
jgi:hypothetical protein